MSGAHSSAGKNIASLVHDAQDVWDDGGPLADDGKPRLLVETSSPDRTVTDLGAILAEAGDLYDRGVPVRVVYDPPRRCSVIQVVTAEALVLHAHRVCRPYSVKPDKHGKMRAVDVALSPRIANMYLETRGEWHLPPLIGVTSAPLLGKDGSIRSTEGYDPTTRMWCEGVPDLAARVPKAPTQEDAAAALHLIRDLFRTFCFADAATVLDPATGLHVVDLRQPPFQDESAFLTALLTAVCRPSLPLAPGLLITAASISGAGAGKGLLARCISLIAFGREPHAVTAGGSADELDKRLAAELIAGDQTLLLDNLNERSLKSDLLASALTERPVRVRLLGRSQMVAVDPSASVILTGNGLSVSEDLARRFITVELDPRTEEPEARQFPADVKAEVAERRDEILAAALTIFRWGRLQTELPRGRVLGSYEQWCRWVRDPLLALGCKDPARRINEIKERDVRRQSISDLFRTWWEHHGNRPVAASELHDDVRKCINPQDLGRQFIAASLVKLAGTRMSGFVLVRQAPSGRWGKATYALMRTAEEDQHRGHRGHARDADPHQHTCERSGGGRAMAYANGSGSSADPMPPMPPMPSARS